MHTNALNTGSMIGPPWEFGGPTTPIFPPRPGVYFARIDPYK